MQSLDYQIKGTHYQGFAIQPAEFIIANNLSFCQGNVVKYVCRYPMKDGLDDLRKARHYIDMLIEYEEKKQRPTKLKELCNDAKHLINK